MYRNKYYVPRIVKYLMIRSDIPLFVFGFGEVIRFQNHHHIPHQGQNIIDPKAAPARNPVPAPP